MGNRAVVTTLGNEKGVYLHWNGGRDSIAPLAFYAYNFAKGWGKDELEDFAFVAKCVGLRPEYDDIKCLDCNNYDNGVYFIDKGQIIGRAFLPDYEGWKEQSEYDFDKFVCDIDSEMPGIVRKGQDFLLKFLSSKPLVDKWKNRYGIEDEKGLLKAGAVVCYKGEWLKIVGCRKSHDPVNGQDQFGRPFFNYTANFKAASFRLADSAPNLETNPNSYFDIDKNGCIDDDGLRLLDDEAYKEKLEKAKAKGWDKEEGE